MKTFSALRRVDAPARALASLCTQLKQQGYPLQLSRPVSGMRYLRFQAQFEDSAEISGLLDLAAWASKALPALEGIDWLSMEDRIVQSLVAEHPLQLALSHQHAPFRRMNAVEIVADADHANHLPCLDASPGAIMVERFTPHLVTDVSEMATLSHLPIPLTFSLGYSVLTCDALATIEVGDVLLMEHTEGRVSSHGKTLFTIELKHEAIMVLQRTEIEKGLHETETPAEISANNASTASAAGFNTLPVELSFVLMEKVVPLNELKAITPGEIVELPPGAMLDVEIRANQRCFARGELIQLANGQLGVEIRTLWPQE